MQVTSGATWTQPSGNIRQYSVTVEESDMRRVGVDPDSVSMGRLNQLMNARGDALVVSYLLEQKVITKDYAAERLAAIKAALKEAE